MQEVAIGVVFVLVGLLNGLPVTGVLGAKQLRGLYGLGLEDENLLTLMRHRAVMLGLVGLFLIAAAFREELQPAGFVAGFASMLSFVVLARLQGQPNRAISRVARADIAGSALLLVALAFYALGG